MQNITFNRGDKVKLKETKEVRDLEISLRSRNMHWNQIYISEGMNIHYNSDVVIKDHGSFFSWLFELASPAKTVGFIIE